MRNSLISLSLVTLLFQAPEASALSQDPGVGARSVTIRPNVAAGSVVSPGERLTFDVQVDADASVIVFDIDTRGQVHILFPTGGNPDLRGRETLEIPDDGSDLIVEGERGIEFVFALAVADGGAIDGDALAELRDSDLPGREPYRVQGDPFLAANTIAGDLVKDVARAGVSFGYTYFHVSERTDAPCYLCGPCGELATDTDCAGRSVDQNFDLASPLAYPLRAGYALSEVAYTEEVPEDGTSIVLPDSEDDVIVNFYPYGSQVRYVDVDPGYAYYGLYDPWYWYYPGWYPYYPGFSVGIGWGWGWGWGWGGYYCSGYYDPYCYDGYYPSYPSSPGSYPDRYKAKYKSDGGSSALASNRMRSAQKDGSMRIASTNVRESAKYTTGRTATATRAWNPKSPAASSRAGYSRPGAVGTRSKAGYNTRSIVRKQFEAGRKSPATGSRESTGPRLRPSNGSSRSKSTAPRMGTGSSTRSKSHPSYNNGRSGSKSTYRAPAQSSGSYRAPARSTQSYRAPAASRGGSYGGSRGSAGSSRGGSHGGGGGGRGKGR